MVQKMVAWEETEAKRTARMALTVGGLVVAQRRKAASKDDRSTRNN